MSSTSETSHSATVEDLSSVEAGPPGTPTLQTSALQIGLLVAVSAILNTFIGAFSAEKLSFLYKDILHLSASGAASLGVIIAIPAYFRPFMGAGADVFPLFGYHRKSYFFFSWLLYAAGLLCLAFTRSYHMATVVAMVITMGAGSNLLFVIIDGVMVSVGNRTGNIGRLQALQQGTPLLLALTLTSQLGGYVTQNWTYYSCFLTAGMLALAGVVTTLLIKEKPVDRRYEKHLKSVKEKISEASEDRSDTKEHAASLGAALATPGLWVCALFAFSLIVTPSTNTARLYYSVDVLHFTKLFLGQLNVFGSAGSIAGILLFLIFSKKVPAAVFVWTAFGCRLCSYLVLLGLHNQLSATVVSTVNSFIGIICTLSILTFAAKACPPGIEASIYSAFVATTTLADRLADNIGSSIYDYEGPSHHFSMVHGWTVLLWIGFGLTALTPIIVPFLPVWARDPKFEQAKLGD